MSFPGKKHGAFCIRQSNNKFIAAAATAAATSLGAVPIDNAKTGRTGPIMMMHGVSRDQQGARSRDRKYVSECWRRQQKASTDNGRCGAAWISDFHR